MSEGQSTLFMEVPSGTYIITLQSLINGVDLIGDGEPYQKREYKLPSCLDVKLTYFAAQISDNDEKTVQIFSPFAFWLDLASADIKQMIAREETDVDQCLYQMLPVSLAD